MLPTPLISVVIQNYNYGHYLRQAIDSVANQDFPSDQMELIIIDDGSKDNSSQIIGEYVKNIPYLKAIQYEENKGTHYSANHSIDLARGQYIHWLAADDFRDKYFLKKSMDALLQHPQVGMCCSDFGHTDDKLGRFHLLSTPLLRGIFCPLALNPKQLLKIFQTTHFWIPGHTVIVKKESVLKYGKFNKSLREKCDWFLFHHIALYEGVVYIPESLSYFYHHDSSYSAQIFRSKKARQAVAKEVLSCLEKECSKQSQELFYQAAILGWAYRESPWEFFKPKKWIAFFYLVRKKIFNRKLL